MGNGEERKEMKKVFSNGNISIIYFLILNFIQNISGNGKRGLLFICSVSLGFHSNIGIGMVRRTLELN